MPEEVIDALLDLRHPARFLRGNGERDVLALRDGSFGGGLPETVRTAMTCVAGRIRDDQAERPAGWPAGRRP